MIIKRCIQCGEEMSEKEEDNFRCKKCIEKSKKLAETIEKEVAEARKEKQ